VPIPTKVYDEDVLPAMREKTRSLPCEVCRGCEHFWMFVRSASPSRRVITTAIAGVQSLPIVMNDAGSDESTAGARRAGSPSRLARHLPFRNAWTAVHLARRSALVRCQKGQVDHV
jgi:hypothetical protein